MRAAAAALLAAAVFLAVRTRRHPARRLGAAAPAHRPRAIHGAIGLGGIALVVTGAVPAVVVVAAACGYPAARLTVARRAQRGRERRREAECVTLCAALAAELRAGLPPDAALASAAGELDLLGPPLAGAARAVGRGARLSDELETAAEAARCRRLSVVAAVCAAGEATGAGVADVLERVARGLAADDEAVAELDALSAGPRATAVMLAGLPVLAVGLASALGLAPLRILVHSALGYGLLSAAALLEVAGLLWVRRITSAALAR